MKINESRISWSEIGSEFLEKYKKNSSGSIGSDIKKIVDYLQKIDDKDKQIHDISVQDIVGNISYHVKKTEGRPFRTKNAVYKFIGRWKDFLEFLLEKGFTERHVFTTDIKHLSVFKKDVADLFKLDDEAMFEPYNLVSLMKVLHEIECQFLNLKNQNTRYRLIQQSIYIQLTLLTGQTRSFFSKVLMNDLKKDIININNIEIKLPSYTKRVIKEYIDMRSLCSSEGFFTDVNGKDFLENPSRMNNLVSNNHVLSNIFAENELIDKDIKNISINSLRNTAIIEMLKTEENLYSIMKLTGLNRNSIGDLDGYYEQLSFDKRFQIKLNKDINILIMKLSYYNILNTENLLSENFEILIDELNFLNNN
ncbi:hypothetical protein ACS3OL_02245 [Bacillus pumilus]